MGEWVVGREEEGGGREEEREEERGRERGRERERGSKELGCVPSSGQRESIRRLRFGPRLQPFGLRNRLLTSCHESQTLCRVSRPSATSGLTRKIALRENRRDAVESLSRVGAGSRVESPITNLAANFHHACAILIMTLQSRQQCSSTQSSPCTTAPGCGRATACCC